jgi:DNA-directed RNA polymerase sigma subunit (sigma70/sigma32)
LEGDVAQAMRKTNNAFCAILDFPENLIKELEKKRKLFQLLSFTPCASYADIISALERIPPRTKEILLRRYQYGETLREIGMCYEISAERVRQIETQGLFELCRKLYKKRRRR